MKGNRQPTAAQLAYQKRMMRRAEGKTILNATHVWMKRWPCLILDEKNDHLMQRILYFPETGGTAQTFALNTELETLTEAMERRAKEATPK